MDKLMGNTIIGMALETAHFAWVLLKYTWPVSALLLLGGIYER